MEDTFHFCRVGYELLEYYDGDFWRSDEEKDGGNND